MATNKYDNKLKKKFSTLKGQLTRCESRISAIMSEALSATRTDKAYWNGLKSRINKEYKKVMELCSEWANTEIPKQYRFVLKEQMAKAKNLKSITNKAKKTITQLLKSKTVTQMQQILAQNAINDIASGLLIGQRDLNKLLNATRQTLISESAISTGLMEGIESGNIATAKILSRKGSIANKLLKANDGNRFIKIFDINGNPRTYRISYYAEMVYRSAWHEAQSAAVRMNNANWGSDLVRVSNHNTTTEICQQYEGKVFSLSGKNKDFPVLDQSPPFHVNCLHYITTTFEEALKVQGVYDDYAKFSNNQIDIPPGQTGFVPIEKRNKIVNETIANTKDTEKYFNATTKQKSIMIRDNVSEAIGAAA